MNLQGRVKRLERSASVGSGDVGPNLLRLLSSGEYQVGQETMTQAEFEMRWPDIDVVRVSGFDNI